MTHEQIWDGIAKMARDHGMSPSALAIAAGMDPTAFNKSKRFNKNGTARWPSTKTIIQACDILNISFADFLINYVDKK